MLLRSVHIGRSIRSLFVEAARVPGRAEVPSTARALALAGPRVTSGLADAALANPASLILEQGADVLGIHGQFWQCEAESKSESGQHHGWAKCAWNRGCVPSGCGT